MVFSIVSGVAERLSGFGPIHSASEFVRKVADQIIGDSQFQNSLPGQRDVKAMLRLLVSGVLCSRNLVNDAPQPSPGGTGFVNPKEDEAYVIPMIVPAGDNALDIASVDGLWHV